MSNYSVKITKCGKCQFSYDHLPAKLSGCEEFGTGGLGKGWDPSLGWPGLACGEGQGPAGVQPSPERLRGSQPDVDTGRRQIDDRQTDKQTDRQADNRERERER